MIVSKFDDAFAAFSTETPQARDDEAPGDYRRRLFERLRRRLPDSHDLANIRADELPSGQAYLNFERMIIDAAKAEGERPSFDNLPPSGELISAFERTKTAARKRPIGTVGKASSKNCRDQPTRSCGFAIRERRTSYGARRFRRAG